jgi:hypothetical protein
MNKIIDRISKVAALALAVAVLGCNGELNEGSAPVALVVSTTQNVQLVELNPDVAQFDVDCLQNIGTVTLRVVSKGRTGLTGTANQVRVTRYRVSYQRRDGGRLVPASFVRPMDTLIALGDTSGLSDFVVVEPDAITQAPFAALLPQNGGRDPDTGRSIIKLDVIMEFFGETLGGDNVYDATRFPIDFCYGCGGCA